MTTYVLYVRDSFGENPGNELQFIFTSLREVFEFISMVEGSAAQAYVYELKRED